MLFNSYIFILVFFPICVLGYFALNHRKWYTLAQAFLLCMSMWFYGYFNPSYLMIIVTSIAANYGFSRAMGKLTSQKLRKAVFLFALFVNIGALFYFKYYDFFVENVNHVFGLNMALKNIVLPLGISFFTFQQISYVIDAYRGEVQQYNFLQYASFVVYFPQLIAGPIVTHDELIPQFMDKTLKKFNWDNFAPGLYLFVLGLAKKVLIADVFGNAVNWGFGNIPMLDSTNAILTILAYTFQVYFDFSGYCDMAVGLGRMMNIQLPVNFDSPYKAVTITEFWGRWHKTLTRFFTKYIYIPMGGNRKGTWRTYLNVMVVYLVSGLWHGANWTFIFWGLLHGTFCVITRHWKKQIDAMPRFLNWMCTFLFLNISWVFFRADTIADGFALLKQAAAFDFGAIHNQFAVVFNLKEITLPVIWLLNIDMNQAYPYHITIFAYIAALVIAIFMPNAYERMERFDGSVWTMVITAFLFVWCIFSLSGVSTFLYFNF